MDLRTYIRFFGVLNRRMQAYMVTAFKKLKIDLDYWECIVLINLYDQEGINQEELSSVLFVDKSITAKTIKSLIEKKLIIKKVCEKDRRARKLYLTNKGEEYKETVCSLMEKWILHISNGMDSDTRELILKKLQSMAEQARVLDYSDLSD